MIITIARQCGCGAIRVGKLLAEMNQFEGESVDRALAKVISARHKDMLTINKTAMEIGSKA